MLSYFSKKSKVGIERWRTMMRKRWFFGILVIAFSTLIFNITSSPAATSKNTSSVIRAETNAPPNIVLKLDFGIRKMAHITLFGILAILLLLAIWELRYAPLIAWFITTLYGATDEIHQIFEPSRTPKVTDVFIDSAGAAVAILLVYLLRMTISNIKRHANSYE
jgi:VanZ family protein